MNEYENLVADEVTENTEQTAEETPKTYTQDEVNEIVGKRIARKEAKIRKEYERRYGDLEEVLKAGTGKQSVEEMTDSFREFYARKGRTIPQKPEFSERDIELLAGRDAEEIIASGYEDVVEEVDRLARKGANMTPRERALFKTLATHRQATERGNELARIGVPKGVYNSKEFTEFARKFTSDIPITEVYSFYEKMKPKKEIQTMGSMKSTAHDKGVKDYYSPEEIRELTEEDLSDPNVWAAVRASMTRK
ncbi:MAG: hypothetical protein IJ404_05685 [Clostridia bacterium]|nr:hypothetical protein [Clostridia bacterium]